MSRRAVVTNCPGNLCKVDKMTTPNPYDYDPNRDPNRQLPESDSSGGWMIAVVAIVIVGLVALMASRLFRDRDETLTARDTVTTARPDNRTLTPAPPLQTPVNSDLAIPAAGVQPADMSLTNLTRDSKRFYGQSVDIQGFVRRVINPSAFTISNAAGSGDEVLVVMMAASPQTEGKRVRVAGQFKVYDHPQIEEMLGDRFDQSQFVGFGDKPTIIASRVQPFGDVAP